MVDILGADGRQTAVNNHAEKLPGVTEPRPVVDLTALAPSGLTPRGQEAYWGAVRHYADSLAHEVERAALSASDGRGKPEVTATVVEDARRALEDTHISFERGLRNRNPWTSSLLAFLSTVAGVALGFAVNATERASLLVAIGALIAAGLAATLTLFPRRRR